MALRSKPLPAPLEPGAKVGVIALSGPPAPARLEAGLDYLRAAGFEVVLASMPAGPRGYLAGAEHDRLHGLERLLGDDVEAIIAARGGYGVMRLLPQLPWDRLAAWGGWLVGFSDLTALHAALGGRFPFATLHGPVAASLARHEPSSRRLVEWLRGLAPRTLFRLQPRHVLRAGTASGVAIGGNLSLLAALIGTPFEPEYDGAVLFLEDVGEPTYRLDRLLTQLRLSSRLAGVNAVVAGRLLRCGRGDAGWPASWRSLLLEVVPEGVPVLEGLPFGHGAANLAFPLGVEVEIDTGRGAVSWGGF